MITSNPLLLCPGYNIFVLLQLSANTKADIVRTLGEAEQKCHEQGSRLLQIRSEQMWKALIDSRAEQLGDTGKFLNEFTDSLVALGMFYKAIGDDETPRLYFR